MCFCRHRNILVLYAVCTKQEPILIVTEYMRHGALLELLRTDEGKQLKLNDLIYIDSQVLFATKQQKQGNIHNRELLVSFGYYHVVTYLDTCVFGFIVEN